MKTETTGMNNMEKLNMNGTAQLQAGCLANLTRLDEAQSNLKRTLAGHDVVKGLFVQYTENLDRIIEATNELQDIAEHCAKLTQVEKAFDLLIDLRKLDAATLQLLDQMFEVHRQASTSFSPMASSLFGLRTFHLMNVGRFRRLDETLQQRAKLLKRPFGQLIARFF